MMFEMNVDGRDDRGAEAAGSAAVRPPTQAKRRRWRAGRFAVTGFVTAAFTLTFVASRPLRAAGPPATRPAAPGTAIPRTSAPAKPDALAVLEANCVKCHGGQSTKGGLNLVTRESLLLGSDSGPTVVPGKPADSLLIQAVRHEADPHMPPKGPKLSADAVAALADWVKAGAPYARKVNRTAGDEQGGAGGRGK